MMGIEAIWLVIFGTLILFFLGLSFLMIMGTILLIRRWLGKTKNDAQKYEEKL